MSTLLSKIKSHEARVAVIGIGYVGLPLATEMARAGFRTVGYDKSAEKVRLLNDAPATSATSATKNCGRWCRAGCYRAPPIRPCSARRT